MSYKDWWGLAFHQLQPCLLWCFSSFILLRTHWHPKHVFTSWLCYFLFRNTVFQEGHITHIFIYFSSLLKSYFLPWMQYRNCSHVYAALVTLILLCSSPQHLPLPNITFVLPNIWLGEEPVCQCKRPRFDPWVGNIHGEGNGYPNRVFSPGKAHGQRSLAGYSPWGHQESRLSDNKYIAYIFICVVCPAF